MYAIRSYYESHLVAAQGAGQGMSTQPVDRIAAADDQPGLRAAEQLVAAEGDQVGARGERLHRRRLGGETVAFERDEAAAAEVVDERQSYNFV